MIRKDLFPTPVWTDTFQGFAEYKKSIIDFLMDDSNYHAKEKRNGLVITDANLHLNPLFFPIRDFISAAIGKAMMEMGHKTDRVITSMWATKQEKGGYHHLHVHKNTFLAAAMYIHDSDNGASGVDGTVFVSPTSETWVIEPAYTGMKYPMIEPAHTADFIEGNVSVFPGWLQHYTIPNPSETRIVIAANSMPIGMTNRDHYDRYNYQSLKGVELKEYHG